MSAERPTDERVEAAIWALIESDTDTSHRGLSDEHYRERRADVELIAPILRAGVAPPAPSAEPPPSAARESQAADAIDRTFGWKHLRKYGRMSGDWMDRLRDGLARNVLAADALAAPAPVDEAKLTEVIQQNLRWTMRMEDGHLSTGDNSPGDIARAVSKYLEGR